MLARHPSSLATKYLDPYNPLAPMPHTPQKLRDAMRKLDEALTERQRLRAKLETALRASRTAGQPAAKTTPKTRRKPES